MALNTAEEDDEIIGVEDLKKTATEAHFELRRLLDGTDEQQQVNWVSELNMLSICWHFNFHNIWMPFNHNFNVYRNKYNDNLQLTPPCNKSCGLRGNPFKE